MADITYLLIGAGFGYLFLLTDAYSRKIVGHTLEASLAAEGAIQVKYKKRIPRLLHLEAINERVDRPLRLVAQDLFIINYRAFLIKR